MLIFYKKRGILPKTGCLL